MAKKLYVGNLSYSVTDESLKEYFSQAGVVESATVLMDRMTGRSKGFGFVEMSTDEEAQKAMGQGFEKTYYPIQHNVEVYEKLYREYQRIGSTL